MTSPASVLHELADLLDELPVPISVTLYGKPSVQVRPADLDAWVTRMDVDEPWFEGEAGEPEHATWPPGTFDGHPYTLSAVSMVNVKPSGRVRLIDLVTGS